MDLIRLTARRRPSALALSLAVTAVCLASVAPAAASGFYRFQHGGRGTAQAGAFTARADSPAAVFYNPAAIARLDGLELEAGLDFNNSTDNYSSETEGRVNADHIIEFPPAIYLAWQDPERLGPWALGIGLDTPYWYTVDWRTVFFAPRQLSRRLELNLFEAHPVAAYAIDERWSVGGGFRYLQGSFKQGVNSPPQQFLPAGQPWVTEIQLDTDTDVDGFGFDAAVHYSTAVWGWGAVWRSGVEVDGSGDLRRFPRDLPEDPAVRQALIDSLPRDTIRQSVDLPPELVGGVWIAPYPELRLELDLSYQMWSEFAQGFSGGGGPASPVAIVQRGGWDDVVSARLGIEGEITDSVTLSGGVAWEPSPVPGREVEPAFPRGDALVYALGFSYDFPRLSFDLGYSFHDHDDVVSDFQELSAPGVVGTYEAKDLVWSASARWRF